MDSFAVAADVDVDFDSDFDASADFDETNIYCPDFSVTKMPDSHTKIRGDNYRFRLIVDYNMAILRPSYIEADLIPITEIDDLLSANDIRLGNYTMSLGKNYRFTTIIAALKKFSVRETETYDKIINMKTYIYTVPVIGFIKTALPSPKSTIIVSNPIPDSSRSYRERIIIINGDRYSAHKTYKRIGLRFVPLNMPANYNSNITTPIVNDGESVFRVSKQDITKDSIKMTFLSEIAISTLSIHPEMMHTEFIHSDIIHCNGICQKSKHCILVQKNDPGFLTKFELHYRSSLTKGQWLKHGTFNASSSMFDIARIKFDEITVKEIRIIPITFHKSFDKIEIFPIGLAISKAPISSDMFVTYSVSMPREGHYIRPFDKISLNHMYADKGRNPKGLRKEFTRFIHDNCNDIKL